MNRGTCQQSGLNGTHGERLQLEARAIPLLGTRVGIICRSLRDLLLKYIVYRAPSQGHLQLHSRLWRTVSATHLLPAPPAAAPPNALPPLHWSRYGVYQTWYRSSNQAGGARGCAACVARALAGVWRLEAALGLGCVLKLLRGE